MTNYIIHNGVVYTEDELIHYGVPGMKWGVRRYVDSNGKLTPEGKRRFDKDKAYQSKMTSKQTDAYARHRIKTRGARQAIQDEKDAVDSRTFLPLKAGGLTALGSAAVAGLTTANPIIAAGAAYVGFVVGGAASAVGTMPSNMKKARQADNNVEAIKRIADIPDATVGNRYNTRT